MNFCPNCGSPVEGRFCGKCGSQIAAGAANPGPSAGAPAAGPAGAAYQQAPATGAAQTSGLTENVASALCYVLGLITGILFLVIEPYNKNRNVRFHAFQSIFLHVAWIVVVIVETILTAALPYSLMFVSSLLWLVVFLGGLGIWLFMMFSAFNNRRIKLPVIGDLAEKQA